MKKYLFTVLALALSSSMAFALDINKAKNTNLADTAEMKQMNASLKAVQNQVGPIVFVTGKAELDVAKCQKTLETIATIVKKYPGFIVTVEGHTDNVGSAKANQVLSQKRAESVVKWLVASGGVEAAKLKAKGYGAAKPIASNRTEDGRAKNRRVDFSVSKI
jgi:outer membrane protein OmpA-like peptidoglycan-associated protein